jgi:hypothetical protein
VHRIFGTTVASVYPLYLAKLEKKGRSQGELDKLVDELARGKSMDEVLRGTNR